MWKDKGRGNIRDLCESHGVERVEAIMLREIEQGNFTLEQASLMEMWVGLTNDAPLDSGIRRVMSEPKDRREATGTGAFVKITGELIYSKLIGAYQQAPKIGDMLVETWPSRMKVDTIAGVEGTGLVELIPEGDAYKSQRIAEKWVQARSYKYGRMIDVTEEMIYMDQTGQVVKLVTDIGKGAAYRKEALIVEGVQDINSDVYRPSGNATALYSSTNKNLVASNPFGDAGLEACMRQAHMTLSDADDTQYIWIALEGQILLVPVTLWKEARELNESEGNPETTERTKNVWQGMFNPLTSPLITRRSETTWYWGNFKEQFKWMEVWPLQTFSAKPGHEDEFNRDVKVKVKVRMYGGIAATDFKYVFKNTA